MHKIRVLLVAAAVVVVGAMLGAGTAQASRGISASATRIGASGVLTMNGLIPCQVLLELTLSSSTILKSTSSAQGTANGGWIRNCTGATDGAILGPIPVSYASFNGTLPAITGINVTAAGAGFQLNSIPLCGSALYRGNLTGITINSSGGSVTGVTFNSNSLPRSTGGATCPSNATIRGTLNTLLSAVTIALV